MKENVNKFRARLTLSELDKRNRIPHEKEWESFRSFYLMEPNDEIETIPSMLGSGGSWEVLSSASVNVNTPDDATPEDLYLSHR